MGRPAPPLSRALLTLILSACTPALIRSDPIRSDPIRCDPQVYVVDELPRNHLGKVNKKDLAREMQF